MRCYYCKVALNAGVNYLGTKLQPQVGRLCVKCLEEKIGRSLTESDLVDCPANKLRKRQ